MRFENVLIRFFKCSSKYLPVFIIGLSNLNYVQTFRLSISVIPLVAVRISDFIITLGVAAGSGRLVTYVQMSRGVR